MAQLQIGRTSADQNVGRPPSDQPGRIPLSLPARKTLRAGKRFIAVMQRDLDRLTMNASAAAEAGYDIRIDAELIAAGETVIATVHSMLRGVVREERRIAALEELKWIGQPRLPKGGDGAGEYTYGKQGDGTPQAIHTSDHVHKPINLVEEEANGGHAIAKHVGQSEATLIKTLDDHYYRFAFVTVNKVAEGSFADIWQANDFVNRTLEANRGAVDLVADGRFTNVAWISRRFGYETGYEAYRPTSDQEAYIRPTYNVGVYIVHDPTTNNGYRVITAYPFNDRPDE